MKVKVGDKVYDGQTAPIMVILTPKDKENIANMPPDRMKYCVCPDDMDPLDVINWMRAISVVDIND